MRLCQCGCGAAAPLAARTRRRDCAVKGEPLRFVRGHNARMKSRAPGRYIRRRAGGRERPAHVLIAEAALGKPLPHGAEVHHVDGDRQNNSATNLVVCECRAYHGLLHARARVVRGGGDPNTQNVCRKCRVAKDFSEFHRNDVNAALGTCTICKRCQAAMDAARYSRSLSEEMQLAR
jgi:hypothetical protein